MTTTTLVLSNIQPDFISLSGQLQAALAAKPSWLDRITSSTGQTLIEFISSIGAFDQYSIESGYQEVFPNSAKNDSSLYAAAAFLGVRLTRKAPAEVSVSLTAAVTVVVPPYTQFSGAGTYWFNRDALNLSTTATACTLYQGSIVSVSVLGIGTDFQCFISPEQNFTVSNQDVLVSIGGTSIPCDASGLWGKAGIPGSQNLTTPDGRLQILFGNPLYGTSPANNQTINITYAVTQGQDGNNIITLGKTLQQSSDSSVAGVFTAVPSGGGDEPGATVYKNVTPALFGSFDSAVTASQYKKLPLTYPGVLDALTFAQREVNPNALTFMNVVKVCLLTNPVFNSTDWNNFQTFYLANTMYAVRIIREDPIPYPVTITATVLCANFSNLTNITTSCEQAMINFFALEQGIIGRDTYRSDIIKALYAADSNIQHVVLDSPTKDVVLSNLNVAAPVVTTLTGGNLPAGTYDYAVSYTSNLGGDSAPANWTTVGVATNHNKFQITWTALSDAVAYKVWGRITPTQVGLLYSLDMRDTLLTQGTDPLALLNPPPALIFTDDGSIAPQGTVPASGTIATYYPNLVVNDITAAYNS